MPQAANEETKEHLYETLLAECRDTIQAVREELKTEAVRRPSRSVTFETFSACNVQHFCLLFRSSETGAPTMRVGRSPTCSSCTGKWISAVWAAACARDAFRHLWHLVSLAQTAQHQLTCRVPPEECDMDRWHWVSMWHLDSGCDLAMSRYETSCKSKKGVFLW